METRNNGLMRPVKKSDQEWLDECEHNWHAAAAKLVADGWERKDYPGKIIPATFRKTIDGRLEVAYLYRNLGSSEWLLRITGEEVQSE